MRKPVSIMAAVIVAVLLVATVGALACPAPPPDTPTIRQMIVRGSTENDRLPLLVLGRVRATRDLRGGPNGYAIARVRVVEDAIGGVPGVVHVRFYRPKPKDADDELISPHAVLDRGERWALVSRRRADGIVEFDLRCSQSRSVGEARFRNLVHLARLDRPAGARSPAEREPGSISMSPPAGCSSRHLTIRRAMGQARGPSGTNVPTARAHSRPSASRTDPSARPIRAPAFTTRPVAVARPTASGRR